MGKVEEGHIAKEGDRRAAALSRRDVWKILEAKEDVVQEDTSEIGSERA
jgi:hypothetical protein